jgi:hypothetical protein
VLRGKFIAVRIYTEKSERSEINYLVLHIKLLETQEQDTHKGSRWKEIVKIKAQIHEWIIKEQYKEPLFKSPLIINI